MAERGDWIHGSKIDKKTKQLRYESVSGVDSADTAEGGCPRKWAYRYVEGIKPPDTDRQAYGTTGHAQVEHYERTGDARDVYSEVATGLHIVPTPGPDLQLEWDVLRWPGRLYPTPLTREDSPSLLSDAAVKLADVPLIGYIDCWHRRGTNRGGSDVAQTRDPAGTVEVIDWKFVGDLKYAKKEAELLKMTQLVSYGAWAFEVMPDAPAVRLSLGYFPRRARVTKVSRLVRREQLQPQLDHAAGVVRQLRDVAKERTAEYVEANTEACDKYGGCPYRKRCSAPMNKVLSGLVGDVGVEAADRALADAGWSEPTPPVGNFVPVERVLGGKMSILNRAKPASQNNDAAIAAEQAKLAEAERRSRLLALVPEGFPAACVRVKKHNVGFPKCTGAAAKAVHAMEGRDSGDDLPGEGSIDYVELSTCQEMRDLADELDSQVAEQEPVSGLPPDAPASDPAKAADQPEEPVEDATEVVPPAAENTTVETKVEAKPEPKVATTKAKTSKSKTAEVKAQGDNAAPIHVFVDCDTSVETINVTGWAMGLAEDLAVKCKVKDLRALPEGHEAGYGKVWGLLSALVREAPLPVGAYLSIHTYGSQVLLTAAEALVIRALASGGTYTRGAK